MNADVITHLTNEPGLTFVLHRSTYTTRSELAWYAAFRDEDSTDLTPERGYGYGATPEEATRAAVGDFRNNEDRAGN